VDQIIRSEEKGSIETSYDTLLTKWRRVLRLQSSRRRNKIPNTTKTNLWTPYDTMLANRRWPSRRLSFRSRHRIVIMNRDPYTVLSKRHRQRFRKKAHMILAMPYDTTLTNRRWPSRRLSLRSRHTIPNQGKGASGRWRTQCWQTDAERCDIWRPDADRRFRIGGTSGRCNTRKFQRVAAPTQYSDYSKVSDVDEQVALNNQECALFPP
jgi:hypothetical protein